MSEANITQLLQGWIDGDEESLEELTPLVYDQLHRIASNAFYAERPDHTLQPTALVHEAYARLVDIDMDWKNRSHFYALAARMMRRILVDHAKAKGADKRGGGARKLSVDDVIIVAPESSDDVLGLHTALTQLAEQDPRLAQVLELHYFGGLTYEEMSVVTGISISALDRDMRFSKAWLRTRLEA